MARQLALAGLAAALGLACSSSDPALSDAKPRWRHGLREGAVGCYLVRAEADVAAGTDSLLYARLERFGLLSDMDSLYAPTRRVRLFSRRQLTVLDTGFVGWTADSLTDTIRVHAGDGFTAIGVAFPVGRDSVRGLATGHGDTGPPFSWSLGHVWVKREPCPTSNTRL
jgi:hypothetical protein